MSKNARTSRATVMLWTCSLSALFLLSGIANAAKNDMFSSRKAAPRPRWMSVSPDVQFLSSRSSPNPDASGATDAAISRMLESDGSDSYSSGSDSYTGGMQSLDEYYDSYQLAWRLLGFYVDCNYGDYNDERNRELESNDEDGICKRMVMYGVYVDLYYEGYGIGEYEYYNQTTGNFTCHSDYCRERMDCHLSDTNWEMLGVFKVDEISEGDGWMEQLFKHEGVCVWGEDQYELADDMREELPDGCEEAEYYDDDGRSLYYDVKPAMGGNITVGLYTDSLCSIEYDGDDIDVFEVIGMEEYYYDAFNSALDTYKQCQPCIAYDLWAEDFQCDDEAGYTNCDQCMKFAVKAQSLAASQHDITVAVRQQTLVGFELNGETFSSGGIGRDYVDPYIRAEELLSAYSSASPEIHRVNRQRLLTFPLFLMSAAFLAFSMAFFYKPDHFLSPKTDKSVPLITDSKDKGGPPHRDSGSYSSESLTKSVDTKDLPFYPDPRLLYSMKSDEYEPNEFGQPTVLETPIPIESKDGKQAESVASDAVESKEADRPSPTLPPVEIQNRDRSGDRRASQKSPSQRLTAIESANKTVYHFGDKPASEKEVGLQISGKSMV